VRRKRHSTLSIALVAVALSCAAPAPVPDEDLLREAEELCLNGQFAEAEPLLREYLRDDINNAVAHYYLGRCYLSGDLINLELARGEIAAALATYENYGQQSPKGRFTDEYFQLMCLTDIAKTYISEIALTVPTIKSKARRDRETETRIERCEALYERAKAIDPNDQLTTWLRLHLEEAKRAVRPPRTRPVEP
jgi:tetratricopeptide (TPR) repeat protein